MLYYGQIHIQPYRWRASLLIIICEDISISRIKSHARMKGVDTSLTEDEVPSSRDEERRRGKRQADVDEEQ